jgi:hypothetical protein
MERGNHEEHEGRPGGRFFVSSRSVNPADHDLELASGASISVALKFEGKTLTLPAIVQHEEGIKVGVYFPQAIKNEEVDPPWQLVEIVMEIQRQRMAKRV